MPGTTLLAALAGLGRAALSDAAKQWVKDWLTDTKRVRRAIQKTAIAFSTQLPGAQDALSVWVQTEVFRAAMESLVTGRALPEQLAPVDEFLAVTGLGFGTAPSEVVHDLLAAFYGNIREDLVSARQGLVLVDNRVGEVLRELEELRAELAAQTLSGTGRANIQGTSSIFLEQITHTQGWGGGLGYGPDVDVNLEPPPPVQNLATRARALQGIRDILANTAWYALYGGSGSGKTQLAILTALTFAGQKVWIRLGGLSPSAAALILESALAMLTPRPGMSTQSWCDAACTALGPDALIVLDDMPRTLGGTAFDEHVASVCAACAQTGVRLLTTSAGPVCAGIRSVAGDRVREDVVPGFDDEDIRDLFRAYDAPEAFLDSAWFGFVHAAAKRHPILLVEAARYLHTRGWATDNRTIDDIARGTFGSALDVPTMERIRQTVPDEQTREFLYRLKLIGWPFGVEEVQCISSLPPPVTLPLERLATVVGLWVQRDSDREYIISPLLARLADDNLSNEVQQAVHLALARGIIEKRRLGPFQAVQAITHFIAAGDTGSAAVMVLVASQGMLRMSKLVDPFGITSIWAHMPLPNTMSLEKRIYLRTYQIILRRRLAHDEQYERADLERLITEGDSHDDCQLVIAGAGAMLATYLGDQDPELAIRSIVRGIKASRRVAPDTARDPELSLHEGLLSLLWAIPAWIQNDAQYQQWFDAVRDLTPDEVRQWRTIPLAAQSSEVVGAGLWSRMADLPEAKRNWARVRDRLGQLDAWARSAGVASLETAAVRSQIIVLAEYSRRYPKQRPLLRPVWRNSANCHAANS